MRGLPLALWLALMGAFLSGCGFHLRGQAMLSFASAYIEAAPASELAPLLAQSLRQQGKRVVEAASAAEVVIRLERETSGKEILSLSGGGKVREYRLYKRVTLSAYDRDGRPRLAPIELALTREMSYDDAQALAKEAEEAMLNREMGREMLRLILNRLAYIRP